MKKVLITGANGTIGRLLMERLGQRYEFHALTRRPVEFPSHVADIADLEGILPTFDGMDAVVHLAANPSPSVVWSDLLEANIVGAYNIYEAARRAGVGSVIFASTNHAVAWWEVDKGSGIYDPGSSFAMDPLIPYRPDSLYGWSKASGEVLGRYYSDVHRLRVFCLRIGWVLKHDDPANIDFSGETVPPLRPEQVRKRGLAIYLSHRDCAELVRCCLDADHVRFGIYYGISDNPGKFYDLSNAREELGYVPRDASPPG